MGVDFNVSVFKRPALQMASSSAVQPTASWSQYVRLRVSQTGLRVPRDSASPHIGEAIQFSLIVEPLLLGAIPYSVVPVLLFLFVIIGVSSWIIPRVMSHLSQVAEEARAEVDQKRR